jgi:hypothetical protein
MHFAIYWWVGSCAYEYGVADRVTTALQQALHDAGIETSPARAQDINLLVRPETVAQLAQALAR